MVLIRSWKKKKIDIGEIANVIAKDSLVFVVYYQKLMKNQIILLYSFDEFKNYKKIVVDESNNILRDPSVGFDGKKLTVCYISIEVNFPIAKLIR